MKIFLPDLTFSQKDKLADFFVNFAVAWFVASIISPFFTPLELTGFSNFRILTGVVIGGGFLCFSLFVVAGEQ